MRDTLASSPVLYVVTHCESCYNQQHIFTGRLNSHLSRDGISHAKQMAEELKKTRIDVAIRTTLDRTKETLEYILKYHPDCTVELDDRFIERDYGKLSGKNKDVYAQKHPRLFPLYHRSYEIPPPGGESMKTVEKRVLSALKELIARMKREHINVLLVAHGNSVRPIRRYFEGLTIKEMMQLEHIRHRIFAYTIR